ncbi:hypothetical protein LJR219_001938 [Phenylobacterium sp. LjRoot219]|uniref:hypothetical protein n=1 Tax=Phenylobacterium sp. LjRoot219 TaxID=3342283 RepID=UPI003ED1018F
MRRALAWTAYVALGPISGPLAAGAVRNWRKGARVLAGLYVVALLEAIVLTPLALAYLLTLAHPG